MQRALAPTLLACSLVLSACGGGDDSEAFVVRTGAYTAAANPLLLQRESWAVYLASESQSGLGSLNDDVNLPVPDNDTTDVIAIAVRLSTGTETVTGISPLSAEALGTSVYFAVDESLDVDWNLNTVLEDVLLRYSPPLLAPEVIDVARFGTGENLVRSANRLFYVADETPAAAEETNLYYIEAANPSTPVQVFAEPGSLEDLEVFLLGESNGLVFCAIDESASGNQNGDMDDDDLVLAILEANATAPALINTRIAISDVASPFLARPLTSTSWRVVCLLDEADHGAGSLNDRTNYPSGWNPPVCAGAADVDTLDRILYTFDWMAGDIVGGTELITGISSWQTTGPERLFATDDIVGVLSSEAGFGAGGGCDYNNDTVFDDVVLRWVQIGQLSSAGLATVLMPAVNTGLPGGASGAIELSERFVVASNRTFTINSVNVTRPFLFWVEPLTDSTYSSDFFDPDTGTSGPAVKAAVDYVSDGVVGNRAPVGFLEVSVQLNLNQGCFAVDKDGIVGDNISDITDSLASWLTYSSGNDRMLVAGLGWAVQAGNSGLVIGGSRALFRVSEGEDGFDWNNDGDDDDFVLFRSLLTACEPTNMGTLNDLSAPFPDAVLTRDNGGAIYLVDETDAGFDVNDNGTIGGFAVRSFRF